MEECFIINQLKQKNEAGIGNLISLYGKLIYGVLNKVLNLNYDKAEIEDVFYEVILKIWNNIECYDETRGKFINFIISVAKYTAIDFIRKNKDKELELKEEIVSNTGYEDEYAIEDDKKEFEKLLSGLKDLDKDIFIRKYYLEEEISKIARDLDVSEEYIYTRLSRGRKKLKKNLGGVC